MNIDKLTAAHSLLVLKQQSMKPSEFVMSEADFFFSQFSVHTGIEGRLRLWKSFLTNLLDRVDYMGFSVDYRSQVIQIICRKLYTCHWECMKNNIMYDLL